MGYYDERFLSDFIFAIKFLLVMSVVRLIAYYLGYTGHVPIVDDLAAWIIELMRAFGQFIEQYTGPFLPAYVLPAPK